MATVDRIPSARRLDMIHLMSSRRAEGIPRSESWSFRLSDERDDPMSEQRVVVDREHPTHVPFPENIDRRATGGLA